MIRFQVNNKAYRIEWMNEPYQQLYMFYEPRGNLFRYEGQTIRKIQYDPNEIIDGNYILVPPVANATQGTHSRGLPIGKYRCCLYSDRNRSGSPLRRTDVFIGTQIEVVMRRESDKAGFEYLYIESYCRFPRAAIFLAFEESLGERVFLPDMTEKGGRLYSTRCIIPPGAYDRLTVAVAQDIRDCVVVRKC